VTFLPFSLRYSEFGLNDKKISQPTYQPTNPLVVFCWSIFYPFATIKTRAASTYTQNYGSFKITNKGIIRDIYNLRTVRSTRKLYYDTRQIIYLSVSVSTQLQSISQTLHYHQYTRLRLTVRNESIELQVQSSHRELITKKYNKDRPID